MLKISDKFVRIFLIFPIFFSFFLSNFFCKIQNVYSWNIIKLKLQLTSEILESGSEELLKQLAIKDTEELVTERKVKQEEIDQVKEESENKWENGIIVERNILLDVFLKY